MLTRHASSHVRYFGILLAILLLAAGLPACSLDEPECLVMPAPVPINPGTHEETNLAPGTLLNFTWLYTGNCLPDEYRIIVSRIPTSPYELDFGYLAVLDETITTAPPATIIYDDGSIAYAAGWESGQTLPVGKYYWRVIPLSGGYSGERSEWRGFKIADWCDSDSDYTLAPQPIYPRYGQTVTTLSPRFYWLDDNTCTLVGNYQVQVSEYTYFPEDDTIETHLYSWMPLEVSGLRYCTRYYWRVLTIFGVDDPGPVSDVFYFDTASSDGRPCTVDGSAPPVPTLAASATFVTPLNPANCRSGPGLDYPVLSILRLESQYEIRGRNQEGNTWLVFDPLVNTTCWVFGELVEVTGDTSGVPIIQAEPLLPTITDTPVTPYNCAQYTGLTCEADNHPCKWTGNVCVNE